MTELINYHILYNNFKKKLIIDKSILPYYNSYYISINDLLFKGYSDNHTSEYLNIDYESYKLIAKKYNITICYEKSKNLEFIYFKSKKDIDSFIKDLYKEVNKNGIN